jgi:hypothetical protein
MVSLAVNWRFVGMVADGCVFVCRACRLASGEASGESPLVFALACARVTGTTANNYQEYFKNDTLALIGYGSQGHGQGLNLRDNGLNVIIGVRKNGKSWQDAIQDGWVPGKNLFEVDEAISRGTIIMNLLSDAAQSETWPAIKPQITKGKVCNTGTGPIPGGGSADADRGMLDPLLLSRLLSRVQGPHQGRRPH